METGSTPRLSPDVGDVLQQAQQSETGGRARNMETTGINGNGKGNRSGKGNENGNGTGKGRGMGR